MYLNLVYVSFILVRIDVLSWCETRFPCCMELFFLLRQSKFRAARNFGDCCNEIMWRYKKSQIILYQFSMVN